MCGQTDAGVYGVYRSDDKAESFIRINDDEHQYASINYAITGDLRKYGRVFFGTNGRGVIYGDISDGKEPDEKPVTTTTATSIPSDKIIYGDFDNSGEVDLTDVSIFSLYLLKETEFNEKQLKAADIFGDGTKPGVTTLARLLQYISNPGKITLGPEK